MFNGNVNNDQYSVRSKTKHVAHTFRRESENSIQEVIYVKYVSCKVNNPKFSV